MYPFFETLKIQNRKIENIPFHQERIDRTFKVFYPDFQPISLKNLEEDFPAEEALTKCKLTYNGTFFDLKCTPYQEVVQAAFKVVDAGDFTYSFKYTQRDFFRDIKAQFPNHEIIFTKNGKVTDTTYSNLVFQSGNGWFTPDTPLLKGTKREFLLENNSITEKRIDVDELKQFKKFKLINSMLDLETSALYDTDKIEI